MNTIELIDLVNQFSFGRNKITERDSSMYLQYLNIADTILYQCMTNSIRFKQQLDVFFDSDKNYVSLPNVYIHGLLNYNYLLNNSYLTDNFIDKKMVNYYYLDNKLYFPISSMKNKIDPSDGVLKNYVSILITPKRKKLVKIVTNVDLETDIPIYPEDFHIALVLGAVYYSFEAYKGYESKANRALLEFKDMQKHLTNYLTSEKF